MNDLHRLLPLPHVFCAVHCYWIWRIFHKHLKHSECCAAWWKEATTFACLRFMPFFFQWFWLPHKLIKTFSVTCGTKQQQKIMFKKPKSGCNHGTKGIHNENVDVNVWMVKSWKQCSNHQMSNREISRCLTADFCHQLKIWPVARSDTAYVEIKHVTYILISVHVNTPTFEASFINYRHNYRKWETTIHKNNF